MLHGNWTWQYILTFSIYYLYFIQYKSPGAWHHILSLLLFAGSDIILHTQNEAWPTYAYFSTSFKDGRAGIMLYVNLGNKNNKSIRNDQQYQNGFRTKSMLSQDYPLKNNNSSVCINCISSWIWKLTLCVTSTTTCDKPALKVDIMTAALSVSESTQRLLNLSVSLQVTRWLRAPYRITHRVGDVSWN